MTATEVHTKFVPRLQAILWLTALALGTLSYQNIVEGVFLKLLGIFLIFLVFIWESAITFLDFKYIYADKNFVGEIFDVNMRLFTVIPIVFIAGASYCMFSNLEILFYFTIFTMGWLKFEIASFTNNIESHFVDIKPTFRPNPINNDDK